MVATRESPVPLLQRALDASRETREAPARPPGIVRLYDIQPVEGTYREDVLGGLSQPHKFIPWKHLLDAAGLLLFERVCAQPEYIVARTEKALLAGNIGELVEFIGGECEFIEMGSQGAAGAAYLIEHLRPAVYVPVDCSRAVLEGQMLLSARSFPWLNVCAFHADFTAPFNLPRLVGAQSHRRAVVLLGATFARFAPEAALGMLRQIRSLIGRSGRALIAADQTADGHILQGAYNDRTGAMAAFNLHVLESINKKLAADFQPLRYRHVAQIDEQHGGLRMSLESQYAQFARVAGKRIDFEVGEPIHTAIHRPCGTEAFKAMAREAGMRIEKTWTDTHQLYAIHGLVAA